MLGYIKENTKELCGSMPLHYPADRVYLDGDTSKTVQELDSRKVDLTNLNIIGTTNNTGSTITNSTYFYLNGVLVRAKADIANGATFVANTNYHIVTAGGLNQLQSDLKSVTNYIDEKILLEYVKTLNCYADMNGNFIITMRKNDSDYVQMYFNGSSIIFRKSTDAGNTWTNVKTFS